ncbi:MAG: hypothetical protein PHV74_06050 [Dehalococcoidia bacterium]|nr:hypothetical protein [Dehalococcoidia bacterium]
MRGIRGSIPTPDDLQGDGLGNQTMKGLIENIFPQMIAEIGESKLIGCSRGGFSPQSETELILSDMWGGEGITRWVKLETENKQANG